MNNPQELRKAAEYVRDNEGFFTGTVRCGGDGDGSVLVDDRDDTFIAHAKALAAYVLDDGEPTGTEDDYVTDAATGRPVVNLDRWPSGIVGVHRQGWCEHCNQFGPINRDGFSFCHNAATRTVPWTMTLPQFKAAIGMT